MLNMAEEISTNMNAMSLRQGRFKIISILKIIRYLIGSHCKNLRVCVTFPLGLDRAKARVRSTGITCQIRFSILQLIWESSNESKELLYHDGQTMIWKFDFIFIPLLLLKLESFPMLQQRSAASYTNIWTQPLWSTF